MKAILLTAPGGIENLKMSEVATPTLSNPQHLRVRLHAAGINPVDYKMRKVGTFYPDQLPAILGCDGAGVVDAVGSAVTEFKAGDEVFFFNGGIGGKDTGNYAEYTTVHQSYVARKPPTLSMEEAAALPLVWITAWEGLVDRAQLQPNQTVLIHAGAGGVGHVAIQLAKTIGARVAVTVSSSEKAEFAKSLGADHCINYQQTDFVQAILDWTGGQGADVVYDTVGGELACRSIPATRVYGKLVTILDLTTCNADAFKLARVRNLSLIQEVMLTPMYLDLHEYRIGQRRMLEEATRLIETGKLKVTVSHVFPFSQFAEAHLHIEGGHTVGKMVLKIVE